MIKSFSLLSVSLLTILMAGCTLTPAHFDGEDLLDTGYKSEMQDPVIPPAKEPSDGPIKKAVTVPAPLAPAPITKPQEKPSGKVEAVHAPKVETVAPVMTTKEICKKSGEVLPPLAPGTPVKEVRTILQKNDHVKITVFREKDLTGEYQLTDKGMIHFPLLGNVAASGLTAHQLQEKLTTDLSKGYLVKPEVNVEFLPDCATK